MEASQKEIDLETSEKNLQDPQSLLAAQAKLVEES